MDDPSGGVSQSFSTSRLAAASGYSAQQVRELERLEVIPHAVRESNGYRRFGREHLHALRAYRALAVAVGPVAARAAMRELRTSPHEEAVARVVALHVGLARAREETIDALRALDIIVDESAHDAPALPGDAMTITELSVALGVRSSTLRFWEKEGLLSPARDRVSGVRSYPPEAVGQARIVRALRAGGYGVPAVRAVTASLAATGGSEDAREALQARLREIAARSEALLRAGADLVDLVARSGGGG